MIAKIIVVLLLVVWVWYSHRPDRSKSSNPLGTGWTDELPPSMPNDSNF